MADNRSTIALNVSSQHASIAVFETSKSGDLVLRAYETERILVDPAAESARQVLIGEAIEKLVSRMKIKGNVRYAISSQASLIRFVKLPELGGDEDIDELVRFEAQQHIPFPLEEVVWDYEVLERSEETEVVIVAIKEDQLEEINDSVNSAGVGTAEVDVAPMALYNAFRAAYPNLEEPSLLIDIGEKTSDLLYIDGNHFFTRSANVGGATVTSAIAREFKISFSEAETQKIENGMVSLGAGHTAELDEALGALATCIRTAMTRIASEIPRTTNYYRSHHGGKSPKRVYLAGGGANLAYAKEFFEEKLRMPVDYFNPLSVISVSDRVDTTLVSKDAHRMGELIGLGLRGAGKSRLNIDLVPAKLEQIRLAEKRKPYFIAAALLLILGAAVWATFQAMSVNTATAKKEETAAMLQQLKRYSGPIDKLAKERDHLSAVAKIYVDADAQRVFWIDTLKELSETFANDAIWLTDFDPITDYNPFAAKIAGKSISKANFASSSTKGEMIEKPSGKDASAGQVQAVRLQGFWMNRRGVTAETVFGLLNRLGENIKSGESHFTYKMKDSSGKEVELEKQKLAPTVKSNPEEGAFAAPFELILPLKKPVNFR